MIRHIGKAATAIVLAVSMLLGTASCAMNNSAEGRKASADSSEESPMNIDVDVKETTFRMTDKQITGFEGRVVNTSVSGDNLIFATYDYTEVSGNNPGYDKTRLYKAPVTGGEAALIFDHDNIDGYVRSIDYVNGKTALFFYNIENIDDYTDEESGYILVVDDTGKETQRINLENAFETENDSYLIDVIYSDIDDRVAAVYNKEVRIFDASGKETGSFGTSGEFISKGISKSGLPFYISYEKEKDIFTLNTVDAGAGAIKDKAEFKASMPNSDSSGIRPSSGAYDFLYFSNGILYGFNAETLEERAVCNFTASNIGEHNVMIEEAVSDTSIILGISGGNGRESLNIYEKVNPDEVVESEELILMCDYVPSYIVDEALEYNQTTDGCKIRIVDYSDFDDPAGRMSADIACGIIPDIFYINGGIANLSVEQCAARGFLEDLTPYLENDPDVSADDLIPSVYNATKIDGKSYYLIGHFELMTLIAKRSQVGDKEGWTFDEMKQYVDSKPDDTKLFEASDRENVLDTLLHTTLLSFVDWEKGQCSFDSPEFKSILEMAKKGEYSEEDWNESSGSEDIAEGKVLFVQGGLIPDVMNAYRYMFGDDIAYIGYPDNDRDGNYISVNDGLAISSSCKDKEAAWNFIKFIISKEYQADGYMNGSYCPTRKDVFEMYMKASTTAEPYTDELGNEITPRLGNGNGGTANISAEDEATFRSLVDRASKVWVVDESLDQIIKEEVGAYFAGDKSVDEVASLIQDRATTYIQETK